MTKLGISIPMLATVFCFSAGAQTINVTTLDQAGARTVLQAARESAQQRNAPSAIAVVDPAGDLLAFQRMDGVFSESIPLAIGKAIAAAASRKSSDDKDDVLDLQSVWRVAGAGLPVIAGRGGLPITRDAQAVGAIGVSGSANRSRRRTMRQSRC